MQLIKVLSSSVKDLIRIVKFTRFGNNDTQTANEVSPYGIDSNPPKGMVGLYANTGVKGDTILLGYINKNQQAAPGEMRISATDANGTEKFYIWLKSDGTYEMNGTDDNAVRFSPLETATDKLATDIQAELVKIQTAITGLGGAYVPGTISIDISGAKITEIKTP